MKVNDIVFEVLKEHWPDDVEFFGEDPARELIDGTTVYESVGSGEQLPLMSVIADITVASGFIKSVIELFLALKKAKGHPPSAQEVDQEMSARNLAGKISEPSLKEAVIHSVL